MRRSSFTVALSLTCALAALAACSSKSDDSGSAALTPASPIDGTSASLPPETSPPSVYVAKVKNILVGLPPSDAEVKQVEADPKSLATLIDTWMARPEYQDKMLRFFQLAFQQTQVSEVDFDDQAFPRKFVINGTVTPPLIEAATESFARTIIALMDQGHPFTEAMTTRSFMMTPALMEAYAFLDSWQVDDAGAITDRFRAANPKVSITVTAAAPIPIEQSVDPTSPNFMHWYYPDLPKLDAATPGCFTDPQVLTSTTTGGTLHRLIQGSLDAKKNPTGSDQNCPQIAGSATAPQFVAEDYTTWKMVTTREPRAGEKPTNFYDLPKLRTATELVLQVPRVGFFSTPAFFANWQTNVSNQMRVTMNQALIVALGAQVDGTDATHPTSMPGLEAKHASDPACVACHQTLDPTRSIFAQTWSWSYHNQVEMQYSTQPGMFQFQGVIKPVASLDDFGNVLATHPLFAQAWAQKLCYYANSRKCDPTDPELARIVGVFKSSQFSWKTLVRELLSSPITTNAIPTITLSNSGEVVAVARRDHFCAALDSRLGFSDVCGLRSAITNKKAALGTINELVSGLPSDGYGRGSVAPVLPNEPTLFFRAGTENICESVAQLVIDPTAQTKALVPGAMSWASTAPDAAIADIVQLVMGITPSDPRSAPAVEALKEHFTSATATGASASDALKSTFTVGCLAPTSTSVGL